MAAVCNLITDSCCDLSAGYLADNGVEVLHFTYSEGSKPDGGLQGVDDMFQSRTAHEFYDAIRSGAEPMTSQPSQAAFEEAFRRAIASGVPTVYLCFSSGISGCYDGAVMALDRIKEEMGPDVPLYIVDTRLASTGQTLLIVEAIRQRDKGLTAQELVRWAEEARNYVHVIFMVDDLKALARGGRIPSGVAAVGTLLDVKPMLTIDLDGKLAMVGFARGRKKGMKKFLDTYIKDHVGCGYENYVCLGNADCAHDMEKLEGMIAKEDDSAMFVCTNIGPTIGCHVGPGMMSCVFWGADRRGNMTVADQISAEVREA